jgi:predicted DNA-binding transcriptional regulator AlpA
MAKLRLVGLQEIGVLHGYRKATAWRWSSRGLLPKPPHIVSGHDTWTATEGIETWSKQTGRFADAVLRWSYVLGRVVTEQVEGRTVVRGDPELTFAELYDLLRLGLPETDPQEIELPPEVSEIRAKLET